MERFILASASPRRRELLAGLGIDFQWLDPDIDESGFDHSSLPERCVELAVAKARAGLHLAAGVGTQGSTDSAPVSPDADSIWILGADTLVWIPELDEVLGKPESASDARRMLSLLAGREHRVCTGLALIRGRDGRCFTTLSESRVRFAAMSDREIDLSIQAEDWVGVAGGYRIQGQAARHIESIEGSWSGIVGLPIRELYVILRDADFRFPPIATSGRTAYIP
jgi:septum formation protein